eukprot:TRINITY_DN1891_c0_g1_i4.p1 TRINITY_DN1891_c0_g1~~TRINITY_DN1891_c0_g1_i4.p1  ORF type:complete len:309 (+),score=61.71 TRINITY_DN1891_c0_g1_i4:147-1073(+)
MFALTRRGSSCVSFIKNESTCLFNLLKTHTQTNHYSDLFRSNSRYSTTIASSNNSIAFHSNSIRFFSTTTTDNNNNDTQTIQPIHTQQQSPTPSQTEQRQPTQPNPNPKTFSYFAETRKQVLLSPFVRINDFPFGTTREDIANVLQKFGVQPKKLSPHYVFTPFMRLLAWYAELDSAEQVQNLLNNWNDPTNGEKYLSILQVSEKDTVFLPNNGYHKKTVLFYGLPYDVEKSHISKFIGAHFSNFHIEVELQDAEGDNPRQARAFISMDSEEEAHRLLLFRHKKTFPTVIKDPTIRPTQITIYALMLE